MKLIAEIKKATPFSGVLREELDPVEIAQQYEKLGASVVSVVTAPDFQGDPQWIPKIKDKIKIPVLRKDAICDEDELKRTADLGADWVLILTPLIEELEKLERLVYRAWRLGLKTLVEVHTYSELVRASHCDITRILVNTRDIKTGEVTPELMKYFSHKIPARYETTIASGIHTRQQIVEADQHCYDYALVGEAFMRSDNLEATFNMLMGK